MTSASDDELDEMVRRAMRGEVITVRPAPTPNPERPEGPALDWSRHDVPLTPEELAELRPPPMPTRSWELIQRSGSKLAASAMHRYVELDRQIDVVLRLARGATQVHELIRYKHQLDELAQQQRDLSFALDSWRIAHNPPPPPAPKSAPTERSEAKTQNLCTPTERSEEPGGNT